MKPPVETTRILTQLRSLRRDYAVLDGQQQAVGLLLEETVELIERLVSFCCERESERGA